MKAFTGAMVVLAITALYGGSRLWNLTRLPVFADEAIYIRWSQIIAREPQKYLFLPLYDGKPPLHMWLLTGFLPLNNLDPLWAARFMSVTVGYATLIMTVLLVKELGGSRLAQLAGAILYLLLPATFFHDRMALIDTLFTGFLTATVWSFIRLKKTPQPGWACLTGTLYGLTLLTKTPAVWFPLLVPFILFLLPPVPKSQDRIKVLMLGGMALLIGGGILFGLRVSPLFPFLFNRSGDFSLTISEIFQGEWRHVLANLQDFITVVFWYFTLPLVGTGLTGVIVAKTAPGTSTQRYTPLILVLLAGLFAMPFIIMGKIVFSRYYLPLITFLIPAGALGWEYWYRSRYRPAAWIAALFLAIQAGWFIAPWYVNPADAHLPLRDTKQYFTEWSAGYGIPEVRDFVAREASNHRVVVATEGYFGTLPDGLLMYFDRSPLIRNVEVFGIGQPVDRIPQEVSTKAKQTPTYLVVNQNRLHFDPETCCEVVGNYPRPQGGPPLLLLRIKQ